MEIFYSDPDIIEIVIFFYRLLLTLLKYTLRKYFVLTCKKISK